jgi:thiol:disulfide interchange protein DsbD
MRMTGDRCLRVAVPALAAVAAWPVVAAAQPGGRPDVEEPAPASVRLVSRHTQLVPGDTNYLGLLFDIEDGWHIYWNGINDSGFAPTAEWNAPRGVEVGPIQWHAPHRYIAPGELLDHVYEGQTLLLVPVHVPADAAPGSIMTFRATVDWLVCKEACLPGNADLRISLQVASDDLMPPETEFGDAFDASLARVPVALAEAGGAVTIRVQPGSVEVDAPGAREVCYYPQSEAARAQDLLRRGKSTQGRLRLSLDPRNRGAVARDPVVRFVVEATYGGDEPPVLILVEEPLSELGGR